MLGIIFCHGWSFSPSFWDNLKGYLHEYPSICWDLGYYGEVKKPFPKEGEWIAIGHSIGFKKLLESGFAFKGFIAIQGFTNFLGYEKKMHFSREKMLNKMILDFETDPVKELKSFHKHCGINQELAQINISRLRTDLLELKFSFGEKKPLLVLGSKNDPIVPEYLLKDNFCNLQIEFNEKGRHALGYLEPKWCAEQIKSFINVQ